MNRTIASKRPFMVDFVERKTNRINEAYLFRDKFKSSELYNNSSISNVSNSKAGSVKSFFQKIKRGAKKLHEKLKTAGPAIVHGISTIWDKVANSDTAKQVIKTGLDSVTGSDTASKFFDQAMDMNETQKQYTDMFDKLRQNKTLDEKDKNLIQKNILDVVKVVGDKVKDIKEKKEIEKNAKVVADKLPTVIAENPEKKDDLIKSAGFLALVNPSTIKTKALKTGGRIALSGVVIPENRWKIFKDTRPGIMKPRIPPVAGRVFLSSSSRLPTSSGKSSGEATKKTSSAMDKINALKKKYSK